MRDIIKHIVCIYRKYIIYYIPKYIISFIILSLIILRKFTERIIRAERKKMKHKFTEIACVVTLYTDIECIQIYELIYILTYWRSLLATYDVSVDVVAEF
jgi:hypothetical protein